MIVHINGMPGVGKLTVARVLAEILPGKLIDNHLILDLVLTTCGRDSPQYVPMINEVTAVVHQTLIKDPEPGHVIFTNSLAKGSPGDEARLEQARALAVAMGTPFVPVLIHCSAEVNASRLTNPERRGKRKLMDETLLAGLREQADCAHPRDHLHAMAIDTTDLPAAEAANEIAEHARRCVSLET